MRAISMDECSVDPQSPLATVMMAIS